MVYKKVVFSFIIFLTLFTSCNTNEPDNTPANIEFAAEDASCTEAWIKIKAENIKAAQVFGNFPPQIRLPFRRSRKVVKFLYNSSLFYRSKNGNIYRNFSPPFHYNPKTNF